MLDLKLLRTETDAVRTALARRGPGVAESVDAVLELDERRRALIPRTESLKAEQNAAGGAIAKAKQAGEDAAGAIAAMAEVKARGQALGEELAAVEAELQAKLAALPNLPDPTAADADTVLREEGTIRELGFTARDHQDLAGERIDLERGARLSGSRFAYLKGDLVMLELALVRWTLDKLRGHGFTPVIPPVLVRE
ncbi:MAG: serS, partial [Solirubrobacterales bacterium]|nr:serS [Solirubrobacterales bacterium]